MKIKGLKGLLSGVAITPERVMFYTGGVILGYMGVKEIWKKLYGEEPSSQSVSQNSASTGTSYARPSRLLFPLQRVYAMNIPYNNLVQRMQAMLMRLGYSLPNYGADGKFGPETERAVLQKFAKTSVSYEDFIRLSEEANGLGCFDCIGHISEEDLERFQAAERQLSEEISLFSGNPERDDLSFILDL